MTEYSDKFLLLQPRLQSFMEQFIYSGEIAYAGQLE
jgi:hypothetical protein